MRPDPAPAPDVRLVDLDGTLLDGDGCLPAGTFDALATLRARGSVSPAGGRQHATITRLFAEDPEVAHGLVVIAENGALVTHGGEQVSSHPLDLARDAELPAAAGVGDECGPVGERRHDGRHRCLP